MIFHGENRRTAGKNFEIHPLCPSSEPTVKHSETMYRFDSTNWVSEVYQDATGSKEQVER